MGTEPMPGFSAGRAWYGYFALCILILGLAAGVAGTAESLVRGAPPLAFMVAYLVAIAWNVYWLLARVAWQIRVENGRLFWGMLERTDSADVSQLRSFRPFWGAVRVSVA